MSSPYRHPLRVRFSEVDIMGVVYHPNYLTYFEEARTAFVRDVGSSYKEFRDNGLDLAVVEATVKYKKPARYDQQIFVDVAIVRITGARMVFEYRVVNSDEQTLALGTTTLGCVDRESLPARLPQGFAEEMSKLVLPGFLK
ncbi:MAG: acyl-CoA thioesterase [Planctomycetes bacterium]|nr:acyl-CoA thioesterase [Planctomycetota bacterium]